jgi:hypothetical protein
MMQTIKKLISVMLALIFSVAGIDIIISQLGSRAIVGISFLSIAILFGSLLFKEKV